MIHHVAFEVPKHRAAGEVEFWNILGYAELRYPTRGSDRRTRWLVQPPNGAVELRLREVVIPESINHVAIICPNYGQVTSALEAFSHDIEPAEDYHGYKRAFAKTPGGHHVEIMEGAPSVRAGVPLEAGAYPS